MGFQSHYKHALSRYRHHRDQCRSRNSLQGASHRMHGAHPGRNSDHRPGPNLYALGTHESKGGLAIHRKLSDEHHGCDSSSRACVSQDDASYGEGRARAPAAGLD